MCKFCFEPHPFTTKQGKHYDGYTKVGVCTEYKVIDLKCNGRISVGMKGHISFNNGNIDVDVMVEQQTPFDKVYQDAYKLECMPEQSECKKVTLFEGVKFCPFCGRKLYEQ